jgi:hypothetical protein
MISGKSALINMVVPFQAFDTPSSYISKKKINRINFSSVIFKRKLK